MTVKTGEKYNGNYPVENLLTPGDITHPKKINYWLGPNKKTATFVLDLGCKVTFSGVRLMNTHNRHNKDWFKL